MCGASLAVAMWTGLAHAESWRTTKKACAFWAREKKDYHNLEECMTDGFQVGPVGPAVGSLGSGSSFAEACALRITTTGDVSKAT